MALDAVPLWDPALVAQLPVGLESSNWTHFLVEASTLQM